MTDLMFLCLTLGAFLAASWIAKMAKGHPMANPVLISILLVSGTLLATQTPYKTYFEGARVIHFLLGPATVALAIPLYRQWGTLKRSAPAILVSLLIGSLTGIGAGVAIGWSLGASDQTLLALAPKSATAPIAMGIVEKLGGAPSLTAVLVILTGITGAVGGPWILRLVRVNGAMAQGFAIGTAAHGIGTVRAFQLSEAAGAFSGLAMGLNGVATAVLVPLLAGLVRN